MTRTAWLPLLFVLIAACGDGDDEVTECELTPDVVVEANGDLAVREHGGAPASASTLTMDGDGWMRVMFDNAYLQLRRPADVGPIDLDELQATLCTYRSNGCVAVVGTVDVAIAESRAFEATFELEGTEDASDELTIAGASHIVWREESRVSCTTYEVEDDGHRGCGCMSGVGESMSPTD